MRAMGGRGTGVALASLVAATALIVPSSALAAGETLVSLQTEPQFGETVLQTRAQGNPNPAGTLLIEIEGENLSITNPGGPGVDDEASGPGLADCAGLRKGDEVTCPAANVSRLVSTLTSGDDVVDASGTSLRLFADGLAGDDVLTAGATAVGQSFIDGGPGNDTLTGGPRQDFINGDVKNSNEASGNDVLIGGGSGDFLQGGPGGDLIDGGPGVDSQGYINDSGGVTVTTADGLCNDGGTADTVNPGTPAPPGCSANGVDRDLVRDVERNFGTRFGDDMTGGPAVETINSGNGDDRIEGGFGSDTLLGGNQSDLLVSRDGVVDAATQCGAQPTDRTVGDRAVADPDDPVDPSCTDIERGAFQTPGPVGTPPGDPTAPPEFQPVPTGEITPNVPSNGAEGTGPGGGGGATPPQLEIISPGATVSKKGIAELRVRCVYLAQACVGEIELTAKKTTKAGKGKKKVQVKKGAVLGDQAVDIPWGTSEPTLVKVSKPVKNLFKAGANSLKATAEVVAHDGAGGPNAAEARVTAPVTLGAAGR